MYNKSRILAVIPARAGSKGIKDKNIISLCGKPLISYTIEAATNSKYIDEVVVSTDGVAIEKLSKDYGASVPFLRPKELASDTSKTIDSIIFTINSLAALGRTYDILVLLQPTSPLRTTENIDLALEFFFNNSVKSLLSISKVSDNPLLIRKIDENKKMTKLLNCSSTCRRQDMQPYYRVNGAIYINHISDIDEYTSFNDNEYGYIMESENSIDIDSYLDYYLAEILISRKIFGEKNAK